MALAMVVAMAVVALQLLGLRGILLAALGNRRGRREQGQGESCGEQEAGNAVVHVDLLVRQLFIQLRSAYGSNVGEMGRKYEDSMEKLLRCATHSIRR
jgi:hypothetical protein